jgi:predicted nuclease of predicted toxin-antitoxin system
MSLLFFSDQCVPREITERLKAAEFAVVVLRDVMPIRSPDPEVIAEAQRRDAILLSLNGDFSDIITYPPSAYGGIIAIQLHNHPETIPTLMTNLVTFLRANAERDFYRGRLFIVEPHRIRIR